MILVLQKGEKRRVSFDARKDATGRRREGTYLMFSR